MTFETHHVSLKPMLKETVHRDRLPTFSLTKLSHLNLLFLKFQSIPPCTLSQVGDSWPESGNQLNIYLIACRWGGGGQVSWVTNSFRSLKDKQLNKITECLETSVKMCHTATSVPPRCHMTGSPSGDPAAHQLGLCCTRLPRALGASCK